MMNCLRVADEAALETYTHARERGKAPDRALKAAILCWVARCDCADGREARSRVVALLLRARAMGPREFAEWVVITGSNDVWDEGAPAAIHRAEVFEQIGADELRDYLRTELPRKVKHLRQLARELLPAGAPRDG